MAKALNSRVRCVLGNVPKKKIIYLSIHLLPQIVEEEEEGENLDGGKVEDFKTSRKSSSKENSIQEKVKKT